LLDLYLTILRLCGLNNSGSRHSSRLPGIRRNGRRGGHWWRWSPIHGRAISLCPCSRILRSEPGILRRLDRVGRPGPRQCRSVRQRIRGIEGSGIWRCLGESGILRWLGGIDGVAMTGSIGQRSGIALRRLRRVGLGWWHVLVGRSGGWGGSKVIPPSGVHITDLQLVGACRSWLGGAFAI
jgi:hypothetical protein